MSQTPIRCDCGDSECPSCGTAQGTRLPWELNRQSPGEFAGPSPSRYRNRRCPMHDPAPLTPAEIAAGLAACAAATAGPWDSVPLGAYGVVRISYPVNVHADPPEWTSRTVRPEDVAFCILARTLLPRALRMAQELAELDAEIAESAAAPKDPAVVARGLAIIHRSEWLAGWRAGRAAAADLVERCEDPGRTADLGLLPGRIRQIPEPKEVPRE